MSENISTSSLNRQSSERIWMCEQQKKIWLMIDKEKYHVEQLVVNKWVQPEKLFVISLGLRRDVWSVVFIPVIAFDFHTNIFPDLFIFQARITRKIWWWNVMSDYELLNVRWGVEIRGEF
jgi:hypothetical protein